MSINEDKYFSQVIFENNLPLLLPNYHKPPLLFTMGVPECSHTYFGGPNLKSLGTPDLCRYALPKLKMNILYCYLITPKYI